VPVWAHSAVWACFGCSAQCGEKGSCRTAKTHPSGRVCDVRRMRGQFGKVGGAGGGKT